MQHPRYFTPDEERRSVEAAVLALVLAEDWPWSADELAQRLRLSLDTIAIATATLQADGLLIVSNEKWRATWTAVRGDELARWDDSIKRRAHLRGSGGAIPIHL